VAPRAGVLVPVGARFVLWPKLGVEHARDAGEPRTHLDVEPTVALLLPGRAAIAATPSLEVPLGDGGAARFAFTGGLLARLGGDDPPIAPKPFSATGAVILTAERLAPLVGYAKETRASASGTGARRTLTAGPSHAFDTSVPARAGLGLDVVVGDGFTFGGTLSLAIVPWEESAGEPPARAHGVGLGVSPRVGLIRSLGRSAAFWMRAGLTYLAAVARYDSVGVPRAHELDLVLEPLFVVFPAPGLGITLGPSASTTVLAARGGPSAPLDGVGRRVASIAASAGLLVAF
jgi:hypothetical protein